MDSGLGWHAPRAERRRFRPPGQERHTPAAERCQFRPRGRERRACPGRTSAHPPRGREPLRVRADAAVRRDGG